MPVPSHIRRILPTALVVLLLPAFCAAGARAQAVPGPTAGPSGPLALLGATVVDARQGVLEDAAVVVRDGRFTCVAEHRACPIPEDARRVDVSGRWIIPGLVDAHVHYSQTGWADGRPDAEDVRDLLPYPETIRGLERHPEVFGRAHLCAGVTATFDVGGYPWTWGLREGNRFDPGMPHVAAAGPLLSTRDHWLNLPAERQFIHMADEPAVDAGADYLIASGTDAIKVWFLVGPRADTARLRSLMERTAERARAAGVPLIVHATGLWDATVAVANGAHLLVHSVEDRLVDDEFLRLAREAGTLYTPTLTVRRGYVQLAARAFDPEPYGDGLECVDGRTRWKLALNDTLPGGLSGDRLRAYRERVADGEAVMAENLRRVRDAGIPIVMGTDAGNPLTLHGPAVYPEMEAMADAGLTPLEVLLASTYNGALAMGRGADLGQVAAGRVADLVVLTADPLADMGNVRRIEAVMRAGHLYTRDALLPRR
jgi:imidazolonepropionase-like amidohydrolase